MEQLIADIRESFEDVPEAITGINNLKWTTKHIFYSFNGAPLGTGGKNRGRCPFATFYRANKDFDIKTIKPSGGTVQSTFIIEIAVRPKSIKSQEDAYTQAYSIFDNFIADLREKDNWMDCGYQLEQLQVNPLLFVLRVTLQVANSFPGA
jgi:hypothetical protein